MLTTTFFINSKVIFPSLQLASAQSHQTNIDSNYLIGNKETGQLQIRLKIKLFPFVFHLLLTISCYVYILFHLCYFANKMLMYFFSSFSGKCLYCLFDIERSYFHLVSFSFFFKEKMIFCQKPSLSSNFKAMNECYSSKHA